MQKSGTVPILHWNNQLGIAGKAPSVYMFQFFIQFTDNLISNTFPHVSVSELVNDWVNDSLS